MKTTKDKNKGPTKAEFLKIKNGENTYWQHKLSFWLSMVVGVSGLGVFFAFQFMSFRYNFDQHRWVNMKSLKQGLLEKRLPFIKNPSAKFNHYSYEKLRIDKGSNNRFDFTFVPSSSQGTEIKLFDVNLEAFIPKTPVWLTGHPKVSEIGLNNRERSSQLVSFYRDPLKGPISSEHLLVFPGGDGHTFHRLTRVDLKRSSYYQGNWEVVFYHADKKGVERPFFYGEFAFPMGVYKNVFEKINKKSYYSYAWGLEHNRTLSGVPLNMDSLRTIEKEWEHVFVEADDSLKDYQKLARSNMLKKERSKRPAGLAFKGRANRAPAGLPEATRKAFKDFANYPFLKGGGLNSDGVSAYGRGKYEVMDSSFYEGLDYDKTIVRKILNPFISERKNEYLIELELKFQEKSRNRQVSFVLGGVDLRRLPRLSEKQFHQGLKIPLGISVPPEQDQYDRLVMAPPWEKPHYAFFKDEKVNYLDHRNLELRPLVHLDKKRRNILHLYLVREHTGLVGKDQFEPVEHFEVMLPHSLKVPRRSAAHGGCLHYKKGKSCKHKKMKKSCPYNHHHKSWKSRRDIKKSNYL